MNEEGRKGCLSSIELINILFGISTNKQNYLVSNKLWSSYKHHDYFQILQIVVSILDKHRLTTNLSYN